jgi:U3 small nucleolar RNA-associated protein 3
MDAEPAPVVQLPQNGQGLTRYLEKTHPETLALARDWEDTAFNIERTKVKIEEYV